MVRALAVAGASALVAGFVGWAAGQGRADIHEVSVPLVCATLAFVINWVAFLPAYAARTERYYDLVGSLTYISLLGCAVLLVEPGERGWWLAGLTAIWAVRLGSFLALRIHRAGSDRRFDEVKRDSGQFWIAWTLQALWVVLTLSCALAAITSPVARSLDAWVVVGTLVWGFGFAIEVLADRQKSRFREAASRSDRFISSGLWAWSRHPNYFGEIVLWIGVAIIALPGLSGWQYVTLISPVFVFVLLRYVSGIPPLERRANEKWGGEVEYELYKQHTPLLWPRPPRA